MKNVPIICEIGVSTPYFLKSKESLLEICEVDVRRALKDSYYGFTGYALSSNAIGQCLYFFDTQENLTKFTMKHL